MISEADEIKNQELLPRPSSFIMILVIDGWMDGVMVINGWITTTPFIMILVQFIHSLTKAFSYE